MLNRGKEGGNDMGGCMGQVPPDSSDIGSLKIDGEILDSHWKSGARDGLCRVCSDT